MRYSVISKLFESGRAVRRGVNPLLIAVLALATFGLTASALTVDPHSQAYGQYVWGDYILVGNTVMRCITATDQDTRDANGNGNFTEALGNVVAWAFYNECAADAQQTTNPGTFDPLPNDQRWMVYNNTDTTTSGIFNSSQATFSIPPGADIQFARLYWSGNTGESINDGTLPSGQVTALQANGQTGSAASPWYSCNAGSASLNWNAYGTSGTTATGTLAARRQLAARRLDGQLNQMRLRVNNGAYQTFTANEGPYSGAQNFGGVYYAAQANLTTFLQQQLDANEVAGQPTQLTVTGANVATALGFNCHGGWSMVVVYAYPVRNATYAPDLRFVEIFDGYAEAVSSTGGAGNPNNTDEVNLALSSFTPAAGIVEPRFGVTAYEGDQGLINDQMQFEFGESQQTTLAEPKIGLTTNYFASTIGDFSNFSTGFNPTISRSPTFANNDGIDVKVDGLDPNILYNSGANLNVRIFSAGDRFVIQTFTFSAVVASISGTAYEDNDNDGVWDANEAGIANVTLTLTGTDINGNAVNQTVTTNSVGYYVFANVPPSNATGYTITETQPASYFDGKDTPGNLGGAAQPTDIINGIVFSPLATGSGVNYNFGEIKPAQLSGSVYNDLDSDGVQDAGEPGLPGVTITLTGGATPLITQTNASGYYQFTNLTPGTYTVTETDLASYSSTAAEPGTVGATVQSNNAIQIALQVGNNSQQNDFLDTVQLAQLSGSVYEDLDGDGAQDAGEPGIPGVTITLTGGASPVTAQTNANGFYQFTNLTPGAYTVTETDLAGYSSTGAEPGTVGATVQSNHAIQVVLQAGNNSQQNDFLDTRPAQLSGSVYNDLDGDGVQDVGEPGIQGVTITLDDGRSPVVTTTNASGFYQFINLAAGTYTVTETDPLDYGSTGAEPGTIGATVQNNNTIQVVLQSTNNSQQNDFLDKPIVMPALTIKKVLDSSVVEPVTAGAPLTFTIYITNTGDITITVLPLSDIYDRRYLAFANALPASVDANDDGQLDWSDLTVSFGQDLAPNQAFVVKVRFFGFHDTTALPTGATVNTATVQGARTRSVPAPNPPPATDDVAIIAPTAVTLAEQKVIYTSDRVELHWSTVSEVDVVGYHLLRQDMTTPELRHGTANVWIRLTEQMITAHKAGQSTGATYAYVDATAQADHTYRYLLEVIDRTGQVSYNELGNSGQANPQALLFLPLLHR